MKVLSVERIGALDTRRILEYRDFLDGLQKLNISLDRYYNIDHDYVDKQPIIHMLLSELEIIIKTDVGTLRYKFKPGFLTDLASSPSILRSAVDNDAEELLLPAFVHDINFVRHFLSFTETNSLFKQMIRHSGGSWWLATMANFGVSSIIGKKAYDQESKTSSTSFSRDFVSFTWKDK